MVKRLIIFFSLFLLLCGAVYAQRNDFHAESVAGIGICSCSSSEAAIQISNGVINNDFVLKQSGSASSFAALERSSFALGSGESAEIKEYFNAPCSAEGNFDLATAISTDTGLNKVLKQKISISRCDNINVKVAAAAEKACLCEPAKYIITVNNPLGFDDYYSVYPDRFGEYSLVNAKKMIKADDSQSFVLTLKLPCDIKDDASFNLVVKAEKTGLTEKIPVRLELDASCYSSRSNLTGVGVHKTEGQSWFNTNSLFIYSLAALAVLPVLLVIIFLFAALKLAPKPKPAVKIEQKAYAWEKVLRQKEKKESKGIYLAWLVLAAVIIILAGSSAFFVMDISDISKQGVNETANITKVVEEESENANIDVNESEGENTSLIITEGRDENQSREKGFFAFFSSVNLSRLSWQRGNFKPVFNISFAGIKEKISLPHITMPKISLARQPSEADNETSPGLSFLEREASKAKPLFEKEDVLGFLYSVKAFVITYIYYIAAGFVILVIILFALRRQERQSKIIK